MPSLQTTKQSVTHDMIRFETKLVRIGTWTILLLPKTASAKLPSRGQTVVEGTINGYHFKTPLEPDGNWSHWFKPDHTMLEAIQAGAGETVALEIHATTDWPEPTIPADIKKAITADPEAHDIWQNITTMSRWEWIRWIRSTNRQETRTRRIEVALSKMKSGKRRPCCWNRNLCTEPSVSKNGVLLLP